MVIFTKKFGTLDPPSTHSLGQSPKKKFFFDTFPHMNCWFCKRRQRITTKGLSNVFSLGTWMKWRSQEWGWICGKMEADMQRTVRSIWWQQMRWWMRMNFQCGDIFKWSSEKALIYLWLKVIHNHSIAWVRPFKYIFLPASKGQRIYQNSHCFQISKWLKSLAMKYLEIAEY